MMDLQVAVSLFDQQRYFDVLLAVRQKSSVQQPSSALLKIAADSAKALDVPELAENYYCEAAKRFVAEDCFEEALACYQQALVIRPDGALFMLNIGLLFFEKGRLDEAEPYFRRVMVAEPQRADVHNLLGNLLNARQCLEEAESAYLQALALNPDYAEAYNNLGNLCKGLGRQAEAEAHYKKAIVLKADFFEAYNNYAFLLQNTDRTDEALACFREAITVNPGYAMGYNNIGALLHKLGRFEEAQSHYRQALALQPKYPEARFNLGLLLLALGHFSEGWCAYEARYHPLRKDRRYPRPVYPFPQWQGEALTGKTILVWGEQGLGDQIQFCRYLSLLKLAGAATVVFVCDKALTSLFSDLEGADLVVDTKAAIPWCDYWVFLLSLPHHYQTQLPTIPATIPYLRATTTQLQALQPLLCQFTDLKVGLCWKGSTVYAQDSERSPGLEVFTPLFAISGARFFTLLPNSRHEFLDATGLVGVDMGHEVDQYTGAFEETAALIAQLDLVITSDTSIAHLAGALGRPTWLVLPYQADWRWMYERTDSPWYPTLRLFRQTQAGDWQSLFERVSKELRHFIKPNQVPNSTALLSPTSTGELLDKITILQIKAEMITDADKVFNVRHELAVLQDIVVSANIEANVLALMEPLREINKQLWAIEDDIRDCERQLDFGAVFVRLARQVYQTNDQRAALKREINSLSHSELCEEKSYATY